MMTNEELIKNIREIQGIVTDWVPAIDPNNDWQRYTITLNTLIKLVEFQAKVETNIYDEEEIHHNCTVQIWKNSVTGETSIGWYPEGEE